jgi:hypothetical protein
MNACGPGESDFIRSSFWKICPRTNNNLVDYFIQ